MTKTITDITKELATLLVSKEAAYGNAFKNSAEILELLYPEGVEVEDYKNLLYITRVLDKLSRISNNDKTEDPFQDIAGYSILAMRQKYPS
jgi:hypothetical protein